MFKILDNFYFAVMLIFFHIQFLQEYWILADIWWVAITPPKFRVYESFPYLTCLVDRKNLPDKPHFHQIDTISEKKDKKRTIMSLNVQYFKVYMMSYNI